jgi:tRNA-(ms[2]io[6]A)-hydroxylase
MQQLGVPVTRLSPGRYAGALRSQVDTGEPRRKRDLLLVGALIEARSCERFKTVAPVLPEPMAQFYAGLAESERRHAGLYLELAEAAAGNTAEREAVHARLKELAAFEARLVQDPDPEFRFHSGEPASHADTGTTG